VKRREFITLLGGAAAWPLAARAQSGERIRRIGVLMYLPADDPEGQARLAALVQALKQLGWSDGRGAEGRAVPERVGAIETDSQAFSDDVVRSHLNTIQRPTMFAATTPNARTIITDSATADSTRSFRLSAAAALAAQWRQMILTE
jgi:putative ABC transport system substrate-binding protein